MKVINLPNSIMKQWETKRNLEKIDILIGQYIPDKAKFVKQKIKKEQFAE